MAILGSGCSRVKTFKGKDVQGLRLLRVRLFWGQGTLLFVVFGRLSYSFFTELKSNLSVHAVYLKVRVICVRLF